VGSGRDRDTGRGERPRDWILAEWRCLLGWAEAIETRKVVEEIRQQCDGEKEKEAWSRDVGPMILHAANSIADFEVHGSSPNAHHRVWSPVFLGTGEGTNRL